MAVNQGTGIIFASRLNTAPNNQSWVNAKIGGYKENGVTGNPAGYLTFSTAIGAGSLFERMRIDSSGNVGIGTGSPTSALSIARPLGANALLEIAANGNTLGSTSMLYGQDTVSAGYLWNRANGPVYIATNSVERMRITATGDVGIGTSSPGSRLTLSGSSGNSAISFVAPDALIKSYMGVTAAGNFITGAAAGETFIRSDGVGIAFSANTGSSIQMRITSAGNVGIGTSSPSQTLHVLGPALITNSAGGGVLQLGTSVANQYQQLNLGGAANGDNGWLVGKADTSTAIAPSLGFFIYDLKNSASRMVIDTTGNVGIGTATITSGAGWTPRLVLSAAAAALVVKGVSSQEVSVGSSNGMYFDCFGNTTGSNNFFVFRNTSSNSSFTGSERMRITAAGLVGIGTSSPTSILEVTGGAGNEFRATRGTNNFIISLSNNIGGDVFVGTTVASALVLQTSNIERMRIDTSGTLMVGKAAANPVVNGFEVYNSGLVYSTITTANSSTYHMYNTTTALYGFYVLANGGIANYSGNNSNLSDERTKKNIEVAGNYLDKICAIPVKLFNYNEEAEGEQRTLGVVAQDVEAVAPEFVNNDGWKGSEPKDGVPLKTIYSTDLMFGMMKAIQELKAELDSVKAELQTIKGA
jgi:hypothetical protein